MLFFYGLPSKLLNKLQLVHNSAAHIICRTPITEHTSPILHHLHWLTVQYRIDFKILLLTYKALDNTYLTFFISTFLLALRTSVLTLVHTLEFTQLLCGLKPCHAAPQLWNSLPLYGWNSESLVVFKSRLKTHLFCYCLYACIRSVQTVMIIVVCDTCKLNEIKLYMHT